MCVLVPVVIKDEPAHMCVRETYQCPGATMTKAQDDRNWCLPVLETGSQARACWRDQALTGGSAGSILPASSGS